MDSVLVIDKPEGLTSHDVVAAARRAVGATRVGHTGTLDPLATGVLPLVFGRATRLVRFLTASDKDYDATIRFGLTTATYDVRGVETSRSDRQPSRDAVVGVLDELRGEYFQTPPPYSAKKIAGRRAYDLARRQEQVAPRPVRVSVTRADLLDFTGRQARVAITCSAGFYVRAFAQTLGELVGIGACLEALRRTRAGDFRVEAAVPIDVVHDATRFAASLIPLERLLPAFPVVCVTDRGRAYVSHGRELRPADYVGAAQASPMPPPPANPTMAADWVRIVDASGALLAIGAPGSAPGSLHPTVVVI